MQEKLMSSSWVVADRGLWPALFSELATAYHPADFWLASDDPKPVTVADLRQLKKFAAQTPVGSAKLAVLAGAHNWRLEVANGLLKLLEEPPSYLKILLVGESSQLLPTLASRVQSVEIQDFISFEKKVESNSITQQLQRCLESYDLEQAVDRKAVQSLLYFQPALHSNLNADVVLEGFSKQARP